MKNKLYQALLLIFLVAGISSCDYLDIVPDERPTEEDAFKDKNAAERYLYSCYAFMPKEREGCYLYQGGDCLTDYDRKFLEGTHTAANIGDFAYWSRMYAGIRRCYTLINNVDAVPRMEEELKIIYKAEANFLIAYYHFMLLRAYGPIIIMDHEVSVSSTEKLKRSPFDVCVKWIADKYDEACNNGLLAVQSSSYYGRATQLAAKALKARLYLYAASPLFNGNSFYANSSLYDPETNEPLMPLDYNPSKWNTALTACQEALTLADEQKYTQFQIANESEIPEECWPKDLIQYALKMQIMDKKNMEVIWADTRTEGVYGPQNQSAPRDPVNGGNSWNGVGPTLDFVKVFYTENGLPIDEDPEFDYQNRFSVVPFPDGATYGEGQTIKLNVDREPRFYAWIAFQNGYYECQTESKENAYVAKAERAEGKKWLTDFTEQGNCGKQGRNNNYSKTGYLNKKGVHPGVAASKSQKEPSKDYPWPVIRLAELYLSYAEACIAYNKDGYLEKGMVKLDRIRERAGLLSVKDSWKNAKNPIVSYEGNGGLNGKLTEIVRQERMIELYLEQQNFWDIRRWKLGDKYFNVPVKGMNIDATDINGFATVKTLPDVRNFDTPRQYLLPIPAAEVSKNPNMVQNPNY